MDPLVSVIVPTYNQGWCIEQTLESVFRQTYQPLEVIVVDDGSTDDTPGRLASYGDRIACLRQANQGTRDGVPIGAGPVRNAGIRQARGALMAFLDGDDLWEPEAIATLVAAAFEHPRSGLFALDGVQFDHADGRPRSDTLLGPLGQEIREGELLTASFHDRLLEGCFIATPSQVMVPAAVLREVGPFAPIFGADYELYLRIAARYDLTLVRRHLVRWRYHAASVSGPESLRGLRLAEAGLNALRTHLERVDAKQRPAVARALRGRVRESARDAYYHGRHRDRGRATRWLWWLQRREPGTLYPLLVLVALWCPEWLVTGVVCLRRALARPQGDRVR